MSSWIDLYTPGESAVAMLARGYRDQALAAAALAEASLAVVGAAMDGVTDDTAAFEEAFAALPASGGVIRIPAGVALLTSRIGSANKSVSLVGAGSAVTTLHWPATATSCGVRLAADTGATRLHAAGFTCRTAKANAGSALDMDYETGIGASDKQATVDDVQAIFTGGGSWTAGIRFRNVRNPAVSGGYVRNPTGTPLIGAGYVVEGLSTDVKYTACQAVSTDVGWDFSGETEGTNLVQCVGVNQRIGVRKVHASGGEPWLGMTACHMNSREICVQMVGCMQTFLSECLLYAWHDVASGDWTAIDIAGEFAQDIEIRGGAITGLGRNVGVRTGVRVREGTRISMDGVHFIGLEIGRQIDAGATVVTSSGSRFIAVATREIDNGTGTKNLDLTRTNEWGVDSANNAIFDIVGDWSASLRLIDAGAAANSRRVSLQNNDGATLIQALNDDNSVRETLARFAPSATSLGGSVGDETLRVGRQAGQVNRFQLTGAVTGGTLILAADGADADIPIALQTKGAGAFTIQQGATVLGRFASGAASFGGDVGAEGLRVNSVASAVNRVQIRGAVTGNPVFVDAEGADSNVSMTLRAKGVGAVNIQQGPTVLARFAAGSLSLGGDLNAEALRVNFAANVVNRVQVTGAVTTGAPAIEAEGADADISLLLRGKGLGGVRIGLAGGRWAFAGAVPDVSPAITGSRGANAALADLIAKLAARGMVVDATTI